VITRGEDEAARRRAADLIIRHGIPVTGEELNSIEVADFGLGRLETEGAQILTLVQTGRIGVKLLALFPHQTLPEHWHPPVGDDPGKEETVRVIAGTLHCFLEGEGDVAEGVIPAGKEDCYNCRREVVMQPGSQITLVPGTRHWFQAREEAVLLYSFSTVARDILDRFSDPRVERATRIIS